jgi:hypothetical protein
MLIRTNPHRPNELRSTRLKLLRATVCLVSLATLATTYEYSQQQPETGSNSVLLPAVNRPPDANAQMAMHDQQSKKQSFDAANAERKRQLNEDSARLLKMAADLKIEVDKTSKDTLSLAVIRKADEIERLARSVKEKMKLTVGSN